METTEVEARKSTIIRYNDMSKELLSRIVEKSEYRYLGNW